MAKAKPNLASAFDDVPAAPVKRTARPMDDASTVLVGANLPPRYARNLALLHAETGLTKKELLQEALDMYFTAKGGAALKL